MRLIEELEGRKGMPAALSDLASLGHGTRGRNLHHNTPGRDDNEAPDGGFGGPQHTQHGAVQATVESAPAASVRQAPAWRTGFQLSL